jgi:hypothetical protein
MCLRASEAPLPFLEPDPYTNEPARPQCIQIIRSSSLYSTHQLPIISHGTPWTTRSSTHRWAGTLAAMYDVETALLQAHPDLTHFPAPYIWIDQTGTPRKASPHAASSSPAIYLNKRLDSGPTGIKEELGICYDWPEATKENAQGPQDAKDEKTLLEWSVELEPRARGRYGS